LTDILAMSSGGDRPIRFSTSFNAPPFVEALLGETVKLTADGQRIETVTIVAEPTEGATLVEDRTVTPAEPGRYHLRIRTTDGIDTNVALVCCQPECLARIADRSPSDGSAAIDKRRVLREFARYDQSFTGLADELSNKPLANFGGA
jgi:hypothetical protein